MILSYWEGNFSAAMLNFWGVTHELKIFYHDVSKAALGRAAFGVFDHDNSNSLLDEKLQEGTYC